METNKKSLLWDFETHPQDIAKQQIAIQEYGFLETNAKWISRTIFLLIDHGLNEINGIILNRITQFQLHELRRV